MGALSPDPQSLLMLGLSITRCYGQCSSLPANRVHSGLWTLGVAGDAPGPVGYWWATQAEASDMLGVGLLPVLLPLP